MVDASVFALSPLPLLASQSFLLIGGAMLGVTLAGIAASAKVLSLVCHAIGWHRLGQALWDDREGMGG